jgi:hypothetical protein
MLTTVPTVASSFLAGMMAMSLWPGFFMDIVALVDKWLPAGTLLPLAPQSSRMNGPIHYTTIFR